MYSPKLPFRSSLASLVLSLTVAGLIAGPMRGEDRKPQTRKVELVRNVFLEVEGEKENEKRRVLLSATVCLQKGALELLMTRKDTKEHEAVLTIDADAREIHKALLLAKAEPGSPVKFDPRYTAASGQKIKITVQYEDKGKIVSVDAKQLIRNVNTRKVLESDWVFAGSRLIQNPLDKDRLIFLANDGDLVCVSNFESALLDLPIKSSKEAADLVWEANSEKIPPVGTKVTVVLDPIPQNKK